MNPSPTSPPPRPPLEWWEEPLETPYECWKRKEEERLAWLEQWAASERRRDRQEMRRVCWLMAVCTVWMVWEWLS